MYQRHPGLEHIQQKANVPYSNYKRNTPLILLNILCLANVHFIHRLRLNNFCVMTLGLFPRQENFRRVFPLVCRTDFVHTAMAAPSRVPLGFLKVFRTFLIHLQNLRLKDSPFPAIFFLCLFIIFFS
jgi:hypothetical protein